MRTAWRVHQEQLLRAEAERLAADPDDAAEANNVLALMESLRAGPTDPRDVEA
jgi:hypothetical protein